MSVAEQKGNIAVAIQQAEIDITKLSTRPLMHKIVHSSKILKSLDVYKIRDFKRELQSKETHGTFFVNESYLVIELYTGELGGDEKCIAYFWQGSQSTITDKGTSALMTIEVTQDFKGETLQVRVIEGKEPPEFIQLFENRVTIVKSREESTELCVYDVRSAFEGYYRIYQINEYDTVLHDNSTLYFSIKEKEFLFKGKNACHADVEFLSLILKTKTAKTLKDASQLNTALGTSFEMISTSKTILVPRLFHVTGATGIVDVFSSSSIHSIIPLIIQSRFTKFLAAHKTI